MLSALLVALREGVEASLVVGIILVYLSRTARVHLSKFVWYGVGLAAALSLAVAIALERWNISEDGFEGLMLLVAAVFVVSMIFWMNRVARHLRKEIEQKIDEYAERAGAAAGWGVFLFVFLMVLREGVELALILRAVELSSDGLQTWIGTILGLAAAISVGVFFFKGSVKVPLHRFFRVSTIILWLVAAQLAITGLHELSEARWLPSSKGEMALIGPIVRNELFFFVFIFGAAMLLILREWLTPSTPKSGGENEAEQRLFEAQRRRHRRWMIAASTACLAVILVLTADFIYARANSAPPSSHKVTSAADLIRVPIAEVQDGNLHIFSVTSGTQDFRFFVIKKPWKDECRQKPDLCWGVALDACRICGAEGYRQDGQNVICRHCASAIYIPTIGEAGGCNPVGLPSQVTETDIVVNVSAITQAFTEVPK